MMKIRCFSQEMAAEVKTLVLAVLSEKGFEYDRVKDVDLEDITGYYFNQGGIFFVGIVDGKVIGCSAVRRVGEDICEIRRIYVKKEHRGLGFGRGLFAKALDYAVNHYSIITLKTDRSLNYAVNMYRKNGFSVIKEDGNTLYFRYFP